MRLFTISVVMGLMVLTRTTQMQLDGIIILSFYPLSLLVWVLENEYGFDLAFDKSLLCYMPGL